MSDPDKIILPGEEEFPQSPLLTPEGFEHRNLVRRQDQLRPENGRRPGVVIEVPPYGDSLFGVPYPGIDTARGFVVALTVLLESPMDVQVIGIGSGGSRGFFVNFDPGNDLIVSVRDEFLQESTLAYPLFRLGSTTRPFRLAVGVRMHDAHRFLCLWSDGRLVSTKNIGDLPSLPSVFADTNDVSIINRDGVRIISPDIRFYPGDPAPFGSNR